MGKSCNASLIHTDNGKYTFEADSEDDEMETRSDTEIILTGPFIEGRDYHLERASQTPESIDAQNVMFKRLFGESPKTRRTLDADAK